MDSPDPRAKALQRVDVRVGHWLINGVINGGDALADGAQRLGYGQGDSAVAGLVGAAFRAGLDDAAAAPVFVPHTRPERGPLWFAEPRTALIGVGLDFAAPAAARGVVEGVLFADRMIIESCIGADQRTLYVSGAFGTQPELPQLLADVLDREILVVNESHLPAVGAAAMCAEVLDGDSPCRPGGPTGGCPPGMARHRRRALAAVPPSVVGCDRGAAAGHPRRCAQQECWFMTTDDLVYVSRVLTDRAMAHLRSLGLPLRVGGESPPSRAELEEGIAGAGAAVITLTERVDADLLAAAGSQLKVVANVAVGFDNIDMPAAAQAGVTVTNTPGVLDRATADHTFALILAAARRITEGDRLIRSQQPWVWGPRMLVGLDVSAGATLGILGYGRIGRAVARRAQAFDMAVIAVARSRPPGTVEDGVTFVDTSTLLADSDVVTVLTPLTPDTHHLIDEEALRAMKPTAYLINTARGGLSTKPRWSPR